ncbi:hypothetical protein ACSQ67_017711 [Phaseolus vulgaris]
MRFNGEKERSSSVLASFTVDLR